MNQKIFVFFLVLLVIPFVFAADTTLAVQTLPEHDVDVSILRPLEGYSLIESFHKTSNSNGTVSITFSTSETEYYARVWLKKDNVIITYKKFEEGYSVGEPLILEVYPEWYLKQKEIESSGNFADDDGTALIEDTETTETTTSATSESETENVEEEIIETSENESSLLSQITGFVFFKEGNSNTIYYIVGVFALLIALGSAGFVMMRRRHHHLMETGEKENTGGKKFRVVKLSDKINEKKQRKKKEEDENKEIEGAEAKIKELQEHIAQLKNKPQIDREKKIAAAKKKLISDQKRLMKLREGKDEDGDSDSEEENSGEDSNNEEDNEAAEDENEKEEK